MASFTLIAGAALAGVGGCSGSFGRRREREGDFGTDCVRGRSEGGTRPDEDWDGFALVDDTVRGRAAGDFGGRRIEGDAVGRGEGLAGGVGWSRRVAGRAPEVERETGRRDLVGLGRFERAVPVPVEDAITVTLTLNALASVDLTTRVSSVRFARLALFGTHSQTPPSVDNTTRKPLLEHILVADNITPCEYLFMVYTIRLSGP